MNTLETVDRFDAEAVYRGLSPKSLATYRWVLRRVALELDELPEDPFDLMRFMGRLPFADESRLTVWKVLRVFYSWRSQRFKDAGNPMLEIQRPRLRDRLPRALEDHELERLLYCNQGRRRDYAMVVVAVDSGVRLGELASLRWPNVFTESIKVNGKTGDRIVRISPETRRALIGLGNPPHVWTGRKGPLTRSGVEQVLRRALARGGIETPKAGAHLLRHTFGRHWIKAGGDVFSLQRIMGHRNLSTTQIYVRMNTEDLADQHARYSPLAGRQLRLVEDHRPGQLGLWSDGHQAEGV